MPTLNNLIALPKRIQRRRIKGWRMPENTVYVGRGTRWGNPYRVGYPHPDTGKPMTQQDAVNLYKNEMATKALHNFIRAKLKGKNLACWCPEGTPCHANLLLEIANQHD